MWHVSFSTFWLRGEVSKLELLLFCSLSALFSTSKLCSVISSDVIQGQKRSSCPVKKNLHDSLTVPMFQKSQIRLSLSLCSEELKTTIKFVIFDVANCRPSRAAYLCVGVCQPGVRGSHRAPPAPAKHPLTLSDTWNRLISLQLHLCMKRDEFPENRSRKFATPLACIPLHRDPGCVFLFFFNLSQSQHLKCCRGGRRSKCHPVSVLSLVSAQKG